MIIALYSSISQFGFNPMAGKEVLDKLNYRLKHLKTKVRREKYAVYQLHVNWVKGIMTINEYFYKNNLHHELKDHKVTTVALRNLDANATLIREHNQHDFSLELFCRYNSAKFYAYYKGNRSFKGNAKTLMDRYCLGFWNKEQDYSSIKEEILPWFNYLISIYTHAKDTDKSAVTDTRPLHKLALNVTAHNEQLYITGRKENKDDTVCAKDKVNSLVFIFVENNPMFEGAGNEMESNRKARHYIASQLNQYCGRVNGSAYISFVVAPSGAVQKPEILRIDKPELKEILEDVIRNMPQWKPATNCQGPVHFKQMLRICF